MTQNFKEELKYLEKYDIPEKEKKELIERLYRLAHMNFNVFIANNGQGIADD